MPRTPPTHHGIPVTTVHRTLLDIAARASRPATSSGRSRKSERLQLYDQRAIEGVIERANGHRGTGLLTRAIADEPQFTRSELEARMRRLVRAHNLPNPEFNTTLDAPTTRASRSSCYSPTHRLVVETDGWDTHRTRQAFEDDRAKDAALTAAGYTAVRFTWRQLRYDPETVAERIKAILARTSTRRRLGRRPSARGGPGRGSRRRAGRPSPSTAKSAPRRRSGSEPRAGPPAARPRRSGALVAELVVEHRAHVSRSLPAVRRRLPPPAPGARCPGSDRTASTTGNHGHPVAQEELVLGLRAQGQLAGDGHPGSPIHDVGRR